MKRLKFVSVILALLFVVGCAATQQLSPKQKYFVARATFNDMVTQYLFKAQAQPEAVKAELRKYVNPVLKEAESALDIYELSIGTADEQSKRLAYIQIVDKATDLMLKYGIKIEEDLP